MGEGESAVLRGAGARLDGVLERGKEGVPSENANAAIRAIRMLYMPTASAAGGGGGAEVSVRAGALGH